MGQVYLAWDRELQREVAVKRLVEDSLSRRQRLEREAQALAAIRHPGVVRVHEIVEAEATLWLVMEHLAGTSLEARIQASRLAPAEARGVAQALAEGLVAAHAAGVIHRDVKPANVIVGESGAVCLIDFGLAKLDAASRSLSRSGELIGSPGFLAPEQVTDGKHVDPRCDVYGVGATLYAMLTGEAPFRADTLTAQLAQIVAAPAPDVRALAPHTPTWLARVCARCLAKEPDERFASAAELAGALAQGGAAPAGRAWVLAAASAVVLGGAVAIWSAPSRSPPTPEPSAVVVATPTSPVEAPALDDSPSARALARAVARRGRPCPGLHHWDLRSAQALRRVERFDDARRLLLSILAGEPCAPQSEALRELGYTLAVTGEATAETRSLLLLSALSANGEACDALALLWLPAHLKREPNPFRLELEPDARRAGAALWLAGQLLPESARTQARLERLAGDLHLPRGDEAAYAILLGDETPVEPEAPRIAPPGPDPLWSAPSSERDRMAYRDTVAAALSADVESGDVLRSRLQAVIHAPPTDLHRVAYRDLAGLARRQGELDWALQVFVRAALLGDAQAGETLALSYASDAARERLGVDAAPLPGLLADLSLARASLAVVDDLDRPALVESLGGAERLPTRREAYAILWGAFPHAR